MHLHKNAERKHSSRCSHKLLEGFFVLQLQHVECDYFENVASREVYKFYSALFAFLPFGNEQSCHLTFLCSSTSTSSVYRIFRGGNSEWWGEGRGGDYKFKKKHQKSQQNEVFSARMKGKGEVNCLSSTYLNIWKKLRNLKWFWNFLKAQKLRKLKIFIVAFLVSNIKYSRLFSTPFEESNECLMLSTSSCMVEAQQSVRKSQHASGYCNATTTLTFSRVHANEHEKWDLCYFKYCFIILFFLLSTVVLTWNEFYLVLLLCNSSQSFWEIYFFTKFIKLFHRKSYESCWNFLRFVFALSGSFQVRLNENISIGGIHIH